MSKNTEKKKISQSFQKWLLLLVITAFLATTAFLWLIQTRLAQENAVELLELNISDVRDDIQDASDENLLVLTAKIAENLNDAEAITVDLLFELCDQYDVTEVNCIDPDVTLSAQDRQLGGLGIYMVKKSMDEITYEYKDGRNILTIKKTL